VLAERDGSIGVAQATDQDRLLVHVWGCDASAGTDRGGNLACHALPTVMRPLAANHRNASAQHQRKTEQCFGVGVRKAA
jgi:hypothetical protein